MNPKEWAEKFSDVSALGVDQKLNYVRLATKITPEAKMRLSMRPLFQRIAEHRAVFGGKVAVFFDEVKVAPVNDETAITWLEEAFPKLSFSKRDAFRVGTVLVSWIEGTGQEILTRFVTDKVVDRILRFVEKEGELTVENRERVLEALQVAFQELILESFQMAPKEGIPAEGAAILSFPDKTLH
jgi:hypothetical protein